MSEVDIGPDSQQCLRLYRKLAASVAIISAQGPAGPVGMTASSLTSLSLRPPLLLACLAVGSQTLTAIERSGAFGVALLSERQQALAEDFASPAGARFAGAGYRSVLGVPVLPDPLAWSVCLLTDTRTYGDHVVIVGEIIALETDSGRPLLWHSQAFALLRT
ncbi:flavin reductase family protein [Nocardia goodfellowii]|uniref:Flavin reductase (DIM6/NTAB) family NADH-FMN oxidoreductase RutF n=1 Tax=Nocardia goodfellowii TaxID=882446 RepID=A0ABS4QME1_9NOCA|nr:flavin reductase family protein [Nocardia goodfellowii]MBP2191831.1 flavin reductase (DIM6/NTAB) family NADH-FMN oxidoreductase RutF [Nocardia goodfellowii]